jgi:hypothetical protein
MSLIRKCDGNQIAVAFRRLPSFSLILVALLALTCGGRSAITESRVAPGDDVKVLIPEEDGWAALTVRAREGGVHLVRTRGKIDAALHVFGRDGRCLGTSDDVFELDAAVLFLLDEGETASIEVSLSTGARERPDKPATVLSFRRIETPVIPVSAGGSARGAIAPGRGALFSFTAPADGTARIKTETEGDLDTLLAIKDDHGLFLGFNDDRTKEDLSSIMLVPVTRGRRYVCLVSGVGCDDKGEFSLEVSEIEPTPPDDHPDRPTAPPVPGRAFFGGTAAIEITAKAREIAGDWERLGDVDVVELLFREAGLYRLEIHSELDSLMIVYDAAGRPLRADDDSGKRNNARLLVEARQNERLRVLVRPLSHLERGAWRLTIHRVDEGLPRPIARKIENGRVLGLAICVADNPPPKSLCDAITDGWNFHRFLTGSLGARQEDVVVLVDDIDNREDDLTVPRIRAAMAELAVRAGPEDLVVFAYSGHGDSSRDLSSLEPEYRSYGEDLFRRDLDRIRAGRVIVMIDACNSGGFARSLAAPNRWVYCSSRVDETSNASLAGQPERTGGSVFLAHLFDELLYRRESTSLARAFHRAAAAVTRLDRDQRPIAYEPRDFPLPADPGR